MRRAPRTEAAPTTSQEQVAESAEAQELRSTSREILGDSMGVRRNIDSATGQALSWTRDRVEGAKNKLSTPKNIYLRHRMEAATEKLARKEAKVGSSHFNFMNRHHEKVADKYRAKLDEKTTAFESHTDKMQGRADRAKETREKHKATHERNVEMWANKKSRAEANKALRKERRNLSREGMSRMEINRIMMQITPEQRLHIGAVASQMETASRGVKETAKQEKRLAKTLERSNSQIDRDTNGIAAEQKRRDSLAEEIDSHLEARTGISENISKLENRLAELDPANPEHAEEIANLETEIEDQQDRLDTIDDDLVSLRDRQSLAESTITRLKKRIETNSKLIESTTPQLESTRSQLTRDQARINDMTGRLRSAIRPDQTPEAAPAPSPEASPEPAVAEEEPVAVS